MTDPNPLNPQDGTPEDVAALYSWANLHGAKYRDFSVARAQSREKTRLRTEQANGNERSRILADAGAIVAEDEHGGLELHADPGVSARVHETVEDFIHAPSLDTSLDTSPNASYENEYRPAAEPEHEFVHEPPRASVAQARRNGSQAAIQMDWASHRPVELIAEHEREVAAHQEAEQATHVEASYGPVRVDQPLTEPAEETPYQYTWQRPYATSVPAPIETATLQIEERSEQVADQALDHAFLEEAVQEKAQLAEPSVEAFQARPLAEELLHEQADAGFDNPSVQPATNPLDPLGVTDLSGHSDSTSYSEYFSDNSAQQQPSQHLPAHEEGTMPPRNPWITHETSETNGKPAWLSGERAEVPSHFASQPASQTSLNQAPVSQTAAPPSSATRAPMPLSPLPVTPEDTLQGSRDRLTSRWFALRGIFDAVPPPPEPAPQPVVSRAPAMAIFSLAGGVGKTSLAATLGRALSARGERVLLVDTAAFGLLPFFFGATDQRPGVLRTFNPPGMSNDAPIQMVTLDPEGLTSNGVGAGGTVHDGSSKDKASQEKALQDGLTAEISKFSRGVSRVIVDLATASGSTTRRLLRMSPLVLVPVIPDMNSVVSVSSIDAFFEHNPGANGKPSLPFYVINQFDASLPLHLDVREVLREQLGDRLLPFALRRTPAMSEALAEGMTVVDYAPGSPLAEDFTTLAGWVRSLSAPATASYRGVRWSER